MKRILTKNLAPNNSGSYAKMFKGTRQSREILNKNGIKKNMESDNLYENSY